MNHAAYQEQRKARWIAAGYTKVVVWNDVEPVFGAIVTKYFPTTDDAAHLYVSGLNEQASRRGSKIQNIECVNINDF